jgi:hypothetical protein
MTWFERPRLTAAGAILNEKRASVRLASATNEFQAIPYGVHEKNIHHTGNRGTHCHSFSLARRLDRIQRAPEHPSFPSSKVAGWRLRPHNLLEVTLGRCPIS